MKEEQQNKRQGGTAELIHAVYLGGVLCESIKNFQTDVLANCQCASEVVVRKSYQRMIELCDKFERIVVNF